MMIKKKRRIKLKAFILILISISVAYLFFGKYGIHWFGCKKCGIIETRYHIGGVNLVRKKHRDDLHQWYMRHDKSHNQHEWDYLCGYEHDWLGKGYTGHYDNFFWSASESLPVL